MKIFMKDRFLIDEIDGIEPADDEVQPCYADLAIYDEMLPSDFSPFRTLEYGHYLSFFRSSLLVSHEGWHTGYSNANFEELRASLTFDPDLKSKIRRFADSQTIVPRLAYVTFLNNAWHLLPHFTARQIPFIFQLYPGGAFEPNVPESDERLKEVVFSPLCRKVIATQNLTLNHLINRIGCAPDKVEFIYGGVFDSRVGFDFTRDKRLCGVHKDTIDICFVAHRYGNDYSIKGYDQFVAISKAMSAKDPRLHFHVVGEYHPDDISLGTAANRFIFYGRQPNDFFRNFYPGMDIILSVNRPPVPGVGAFDGFPTGACMEAGFSGVLNCVHDPLGLNVAFEDGRDIVLLSLDPSQNVQRLSDLFADLDRLYDLARANWERFLQVFDVDRQLWARTRLIVDELSRTERLVIRPAAVASVLREREEIRKLRNLAEFHESRHDNLLAEYRKLAAGYEDLRNEVSASREIICQLNERPELVKQMQREASLRKYLGKLRGLMRSWAESPLSRSRIRGPELGEDDQ